VSHMTQTANPVTLTSYSSPCGRYHNPRPERPSNLRTLRPSVRSILRTLTPKVCPRAIHNPRGQRPRQTYEPLGSKGPSILRTFFPQPFYTTCLRQQAITFGPQARPLSEPSETCGLGPFGTAYHLSVHSSVGRQKESALMGRLGALLRPTWRSYAGLPQWHNKDFKFLLHPLDVNFLK